MISSNFLIILRAKVTSFIRFLGCFKSNVIFMYERINFRCYLAEADETSHGFVWTDIMISLNENKKKYFLSVIDML